jgi:hypothetical protein
MFEGGTRGIFTPFGVAQTQSGHCCPLMNCQSWVSHPSQRIAAAVLLWAYLDASMMRYEQPGVHED